MSAVLKEGAPRLVPIGPADLDQVMEIENDIYEFPWTRGNFNDSMSSGYSCWAFVDGSQMIGYCVVMLAVDEAHLLNLSIARSWQGRGYGRALLEHAMRMIHEHGAQSMLLEVRPSKSRPEQGLIKVKMTTLNQDGEAVQVLIANLIVPRRTVVRSA